MRDGKNICVIIPTLNEETAIGKVIADIPDWVDVIIVSDNGSKDGTIEIASELGAIVLKGEGGGYGAACLTGIKALPDTCDIVVFVDGDYSDYPDRMDALVDPIIGGDAQLVIGSRTLGNAQAGSLTLPQVFGNWLACFLIKLFWGVKYTDLGPFRAIERNALKRLKMTDKAFGWTVQMQLHSIFYDVKTIEVPVDYKPRIGRSKISGTIRGTVLAGWAILGTILRAWFFRFRP
jgi:glycosyltransferase involved in cell wall biosynthesis